MPDTAAITGNGVDISGAVLPNYTFRIDRVSGQTVASGNAFSVGETFVAVTNASGTLGRIVAGDFVAGIDLVVGHTYRVTPQRQQPLFGDLKAYLVYIPEEATSGTINDFLVSQPVPPVTQSAQILAQAQGAADDAQGFALEAATYDPTLRAVSIPALLASERASAGVGTIWQAGDVLFEEVAADTPDAAFVTAEGVRLRYRAGGTPAGYLPEWESIDLNTGSQPVEFVLGVAHGKLIGVTTGGNLRKSADGLNWSGVIVTGTPMSITRSNGAIFALGDGEVLIVANSAHELWKSTGWQANPATATWAKVAETDTYAQGRPRFHQGWSVRVAGQYVIAAEYGNPKPQAHKVYLSTNHGSTFTEVFDQRDFFTLDGSSDAHMHGACVDIWHGSTPRLWVHSSDTPYQRLWYSDDLGDNWTPVADEDYPTATSVGDIANPVSADVMPPNYVILDASPWGIVIGQDDKPEGTAVILRDATYATAPRVRTAAIINEGVTALQYVCQASTRVGEWFYHLHNPTTGGIGKVPPRITATHAPSGAGFVVWEGPKALINLRKIDAWHGSLWVRESENVEVIRIPLFQTQERRRTTLEQDTSRILGGRVTATDNTLAIHKTAEARFPGSMALSYEAKTTGVRQLVMAPYALVLGNDVIAISPGVYEFDNENNRLEIDGSLSIGIGNRVQIDGASCVGIGDRIEIDGNNGTGVGSNVKIGAGGTATGRDAQALNTNSVSYGRNALASGSRAAAFGTDTEATGGGSFAGGRAAKATHNNAIALGSFSETTAINQMNIGDRYLQMGGFTSDRSTPPSGQVALFFRSDTGELRVRFPNGTTKTITDDS